MNGRDGILLIANNFPPVLGGSAVVYGALAREAAPQVSVLAPRISYTDGLPLIGWREHDRAAARPRGGQPGYRVTRLALLRTPIDGPHNGGAGRLHFIARDLLIRLRIIAAVRAALRQGRIGAVCIGELVPSGWLFSVLRLWPGLRRIVYIHGEEITTRDNYDPDWSRRRRTLAAADAIIVVSRFTAGAVRMLLAEITAPPILLPPILLIENGVDFHRFAASVRRADLVAHYGLEGAFVFVSVCRLLEKKGIDNAIRAFAGLWRDHPECRFLVVGAGPFAGTLQTIAIETGVADAVVFAGAVADADLADHYALGDVFVMPNRALPSGDTEGFGLVFLEANAAGVPVIAGRDGGSVDAVTDGVNGLVVDGHAVDAIEDAMRRLYDDPQLRADLAQRGIACAEAADWRVKARDFIAACLGRGHAA
ncbi:MAG: glycosyltransferase family 4 protein [Acidiphilium sp.]|nr:glycosyltransferase family 4 protein [Acidiphilium sp.]MDD4936330.1 glycosyltransferase family 4 protein [Acidiphilium sp.]